MNGHCPLIFGEGTSINIIRGTNHGGRNDLPTYGGHIAQTLHEFLSSQLVSEPFYFISRKRGQALDESDNNNDTNASFKDLSGLDSSTARPDTVDSRDMFGSPLKLQAIADLSVKSSHSSTSSTPTVTNYSLLPLTINEARNVLQRFNRAHEKESDINTVMAFCDGNDHRKTILLGMKLTFQNDTKNLKLFYITAGRTKLPELEQLLEERDLEHHLTARYQVLDVKFGLGSMVLEAKWSDPKGRMKLSKLQSPEFSMILHILSGCDQSPAYNFFCQMQKVQLLLAGLKAGRPPTLQSQRHQPAAVELQEVLARMKEGMKMTSLLQGQTDKNAQMASMLSSTSKQLHLEPAADGDFTDILWQIIRDCTDLADLVQCLNMTFIALRAGNLKAFVHSSNQTTIAKLVRQSNCGMAAFPSLSGSLPLRLATEIGLEKIIKDYRTVFVGNHLCTLNQWNAFFQAQTVSREDITNMEELDIWIMGNHLNILTKLHHCLETVSVLDSYTDGLDLGVVARHIMNRYTSENIHESQSFIVPITAVQGSTLVTKYPLHMMKRESLASDSCRVDSVTSDLPEELLDHPLMSNSKDVRSLVDTFYMFRSYEHDAF